MALPPQMSLDDVKIKIRQAYSNPRVGNIRQVVLKDGPRAFRIATVLEIVDPETRALHHYSLKIDHIDRRKSGWFANAERSVRLDGGSPNEIERLYRFLHALMEGSLAEQEGELHVIRSSDYARLESLLDALPNLASSDKIQLIKAILDQLDESPSVVQEFVSAFEQGRHESIKHIAAASRFVEYRAAFRELVELVQESSTLESAFQRHLATHPWMFGSEYSELLPRRTWTRDDNLDYMLRRTVDGYLEIIEIKTAFLDPLFVHDRSHDAYHQSAKLSSVVGQVIRYVEEVERNRDSIKATDDEDPLKIRARVIVGRDGDTRHQAALRSLNAHLHGIEIITFDQLVRIAKRVLDVFDPSEGAIADVPDDIEVPF